MKTMVSWMVVVLCGVLALPVLATPRNMEIVVSPPVLVNHSKGPPSMTVHADVLLREANLDSVRLVLRTQNGVQTIIRPSLLFADRCGELVAKFDTAIIRAAIPVPQYAYFLLEVRRLDGRLFVGSYIVIVK